MASDITPEAIGFLSAVAVFVALLIILFLFINKKLCFARVGGLPCLEQYGHRKRKGGVHQGLVNSYGEDAEQSSSSDSENDIAKQFEISVSRSQSFRSGVTEVSTQSVSGRQPKFQRLLSDQEEASTEPSDFEDVDRASLKSYQDPLSRANQEDLDQRDALSRPSSRLTDRQSMGSRERSLRASIGSQDMADRAETLSRTDAEGGRSRSRTGGSRSSSVRHQTPTFGNLEMETVVDNQGYDNNEAANSSSTGSPEDQTGGRDSFSLSPSSSSHPPISKCGDLVLVYDYRPEAQKLMVTVVMARGVPDKARSGMDAWQVHVVLLPGKRQRHKTAVQKGSAPHFGETFRFSRVDPADLGSSALRFRLYAQGRMNKEKMMGETIYKLSGLSTHTAQTEVTLVLEPRSNIKSLDSQVSLSAQSDNVSSNQSLSHGGLPELLLGLAYNATTGRLSVELIKGTHFRNMAVNRPPDTYGKLTLLNSMGQEISRCKTSVRRGQPNPVYKETFVFQVALFQLSDVTLMVSIYNRRNMKRKEMIGWIALGQNSSGEEELLHWQDMRESGNQQVCRWHALLEA